MVGGSAEAGIVSAGGGLTASAGGGLFWGDKNSGLNAGAFGSFGAYAGGPGYGMQCPKNYPAANNSNVAGGAFAGVGVGLFATNATKASELAGPFNTWTFNVCVGPVQLSVQFGKDGGTWIGSVTVGPGIGISGSGYPTTTKTIGP